MLNKRQHDALKYISKRKIPANDEGHERLFQKTRFPETYKELYRLGCLTYSDISFGAARGFYEVTQKGHVALLDYRHARNKERSDKIWKFTSGFFAGLFSGLAAALVAYFFLIHDCFSIPCHVRL